MSATFRTNPTSRKQRRLTHPSLSPARRPTLVTSEGVPPIAAERRLPGGASLLERRPNPGVAELQLVGEVDAFDRGAIIDACTAVGLEGARHLRIDGSDLAFVDLRILEALTKVALHFQRFGGSFELVGLREPFSAMWAGIAPDMAASAPARQGPLDDYVVPLHGLESTEAARVSASPAPQASAPMTALRIVPDIGTDGAGARSRPA